MMFLVLVFFSYMSLQGANIVLEEQNPSASTLVKRDVVQALTFAEQEALLTFLGLSARGGDSAYVMRAVSDTLSRIFELPCIAKRQYRQCCVYLEDTDVKGKIYNALQLYYVQQSAGLFFIFPQDIDNTKVPEIVQGIFDKVMHDKSYVGRGVLLAMASRGRIFQNIDVMSKSRPPLDEIYDVQTLKHVFA